MTRFNLTIGSAVVAIGVTVIGAAVSQPISDAITKTFRKDYYTVEGDSWTKVQAAIAQNQQVIPGTNDRYEGLTTAKVKLTFGNSPDGICDTSQAALQLDLVVRVPRASNQSALGAADKECWAYYDRSLADHEEGHIYIAVHDAKELLQKVRAKRKASCGDLQRMVDKSVASTQATQDQYDDVSSHGMRQWRAWGSTQDVETDYGKSVRDRCSGS